MGLRFVRLLLLLNWNRCKWSVSIKNFWKIKFIMPMIAKKFWIKLISKRSIVIDCLCISCDHFQFLPMTQSILAQYPTKNRIFLLLLSIQEEKFQTHSCKPVWSCYYTVFCCWYIHLNTHTIVSESESETEREKGTTSTAIIIIMKM